jgi:hypothetical protein
MSPAPIGHNKKGVFGALVCEIRNTARRKPSLIF